MIFMGKSMVSGEDFPNKTYPSEVLHREGQLKISQLHGAIGFQGCENGLGTWSAENAVRTASFKNPHMAVWMGIS